MKKQDKRGRRWTDQEIFDAFNKWAAEHEGRPPSFRDWQRASNGHPTAMTVRVRFGSWRTALEMLGFEPGSPGTRRSTLPPSRQRLREKAQRLRRRGHSIHEINAYLGVPESTLRRWLGPLPPQPKKPRTSAEKREVRIAALREALAKEKG